MSAASKASIAELIGYEVSSPGYYEQALQAPSWPGGASGVTIGIGYDVGMTNETDFRADWGDVLEMVQVESLAQCCGVSGALAKAMADARSHIRVSLAAASTVFRAKSIPHALAQTVGLFDCSRLPDDCTGALLSLVYNRGTSLAGDRRREMAQIQKALPSHPELVPDLLRSMSRLWPDVPGLQKRRESEARRFEVGLAAIEVVG